MLLSRDLNKGAEDGAQALSRAGIGGHEGIALRMSPELHMSKRGERERGGGGERDEREMAAFARPPQDVGEC